MYQYNNNQGYIALISVIVLGAILMAVAASLSIATFTQSGAGIDAESKERSYFLAYSCIDHALLMLTQSPGYTGNETYMIDTDQCQVGAITTGVGGGSGTLIIPASATIGTSTSSLLMTIDAATLQTISFKET